MPPAGVGPTAGPHFVYAKLLDPVDPVRRHEKYEDPLIELLDAEGLGEVTGGGTMQSAGKIEFVGIDLELTDLPRAIPLVAAKLAALGAPPGSTLEFEVDGRPQSVAMA